MITKYSPGTYEELFAKANKALKEKFSWDTEEYEAQKIISLDDYFTCIKDLKDYQQEHPEEDPIFLVLPTDEPTFDIDANTRKITVPKAFMNGVSVQGDQAAEIIYFSIDRYFDTVDLANKEILVQWKNAQGNEGISVTWNKCLSIQPGKIVFGWPITSEITENAGNITFSIRFYQREFNEVKQQYNLLYSFSTLSAVIKINPSLDIDMLDKTSLDDLINHNKMLEERLTNSAVTDIGKLQAAKPVFEINLPAKQNLDGENVILKAKAHIPASIKEGVGNISYSWIHTNKDGSVIKSPGTKVYEETQDKSRQGNDIYYYKVNENSPSSVTDPEYRIYTNTNPDDFAKQKLYELSTTFIADEVGSYKVTATNLYRRGDTGVTVSELCTIPRAVAPNLVYTSGKHFIITKDITASITASCTDGGELKYSWFKNKENSIDTATKIEGQVSNEITISQEDGEGYYFLKATNTKNKDTSFVISEPIVATLPAQKPKITAHLINETVIDNALTTPIEASQGDSIGVKIDGNIPPTNISYQWYKVAKEPDQDRLIDGATSATYNKGKPGDKLYVKIINDYNTDIATVNSRTFIIVS